MLRIGRAFFAPATLLVWLFLGVQIACDSKGSNLQRAEKNQSGEAPASSVAQVTGSLNHERYYIANSVSWIIGDNVFLTATIETRKLPTETARPVSKIMVKNLSSNTILYQQEVEGTPLSMYTRNVTPDPNPELIVDWDIAAASNQFQMFSVSSSLVTMLLDENYRLDTTFIDLGNDGIGLLITTGEGGAGPFETTLYTFQNNRCEIAGKGSHQSLISDIRKLLISAKK